MPLNIRTVVVTIDPTKGPSQGYASHSHSLTDSNSTLATETSRPPPVTLAPYSPYELFGNLLSAIPLHLPIAVVQNVIKPISYLLYTLPWTLSATIFAALMLHIAYRTIIFILAQYQEFLGLGKGGTPQTPAGFINCSTKAFFCRVNVLIPPRYDPALQPGNGRLSDLQTRPGDRPMIKGVAPQRQIDQKPDSTEKTFDRLSKMMEEMARKDELLEVIDSYLEGHTGALVARFPHRPSKILGSDGEWNFEIAHPHRIDGSVHVILHPEDVCNIIESGWGERHPLATRCWAWKTFWHKIMGTRRPTPYNLVLIYAPRDDFEFSVVQQILNAAVWYHKAMDRLIPGHPLAVVCADTSTGPK